MGRHAILDLENATALELSVAKGCAPNQEGFLDISGHAAKAAW